MTNTKVAARLKVCRECLGLRGPCFDTFNRCERIQRCTCEPEEPRWNAYDYNRAIELCLCCAAAPVSSGSRWSPFFCAACRELVVAYNQAAGVAVIPIGRHSIMNQVSLSAENTKSARARAVFAASMQSFFERVRWLWKWHEDCVRAVVQSIPGSRATIPLARYFDHARARSETSDLAFAALVVGITAPPVRVKARAARTRVSKRRKEDRLPPKRAK